MLYVVKKITSLILSVLLVMGSISVVSAENLVMEDKVVHCVILWTT